MMQLFGVETERSFSGGGHVASPELIDAEVGFK